MVYFLKQIRKEFTKELYKELTTRHLRIKKTKDVVAACYYFPFIKRIVKQVVKECNICQKAKTLRKHLYRLLKLLDTPLEL
jgi:glutamate racemase